MAPLWQGDLLASNALPAPGVLLAPGVTSAYASPYQNMTDRLARLWSRWDGRVQHMQLDMELERAPDREIHYFLCGDLPAGVSLAALCLRQRLPTCQL